MRLDKSIKTNKVPAGRRVAIVVARYNENITESLARTCRNVLLAGGVAEKDIALRHAPGAFELPLICMQLARAKKYDAVIALGCIVRGETPHDRYIAHAVANGLMRVSLDTGVPVLFGVLTTLNDRQAKARSTGRLDKGAEVARAALDMMAGESA